MGFWKYDDETWAEVLTEFWEIFRAVGVIRSLRVILLMIPLAVVAKLCLKLSRGFEMLARWSERALNKA